MNKEAAKLGLILGAISLAIAILLSVVNLATRDIIAMRQEQDIQNALAKVVPDAVFERLDTATEAYAAKKDGNIIGYCVKTAPYGYGGEIVMIVGVTTDLSVTGVSVTSMEETPGLGALAQKDEFLSGYKGKKGELKVTKDGGEIETLSGATITSRAVTAGVNEAVAFVANLTGGN